MGATSPPVIVATSTWNSGDIIHDFLRYYRYIGAAAALVLEFGSTDQTRTLLESERWRSFVRIIELPSIEETDRSNLLLAYAKEHFSGEHWCLFCDPDEFLVTPDTRIGSSCASRKAGERSALTIPRKNVTALRSVARDADHELIPSGALTLRIDRQHRRGPEAVEIQGPLEPPWIFTAIDRKVTVRLSHARAVPLGDFAADVVGDGDLPVSSDCYLLHYPFRSYREFADKVELAKLDFHTNDYPSQFGWQYRRWFRCSDRGELRDEYLAQFVEDGRLHELLADGTLTIDRSVRHSLAKSAELADTVGGKEGAVLGVARPG